jgi:HlyD family secretion protein
MKSGFPKIVLIALAVLGILSAIAAVKYFNSKPPEDRLLLSGLIEADEIHVGSKVGGRIASVLVEAGREVKQGEPLVKFESFDLEARRNEAIASIRQSEANLEKLSNLARPEEVAEAKAQLDTAKSNLDLARNGPRKQEIDQARADLEAVNADYNLAKSNFERIISLTETGDTSRQDFDNAKAALERAKARQDAARKRLDLLLAGTRQEEIRRAEGQLRQAEARKDLVVRGARKEDIAGAQAQLDRARASLQAIETQLAELEVKSPANAFVEVLQVRPGDLIAPNSSIATLVEVDRLWVRVYIPEPELGNAQLGKEVDIKVDTFPNEIFKGRIEQISSRGEFTPRNVQTREERAHQVFAIRVRINNDSHKLRPGMAADLILMLGDRSNIR